MRYPRAGSHGEYASTLDEDRFADRDRALLASDGRRKRSFKSIDDFVDISVVVRSRHACPRRDRELEHNDLPGAFCLIDKKADLEITNSYRSAIGGLHWIFSCAPGRVLEPAAVRPIVFSWEGTLVWFYELFDLLQAASRPVSQSRADVRRVSPSLLGYRAPALRVL